MGTMTDHIAQLVLSVFLIVGVYQFYFWCQTNPLSIRTRFLHFSVDDRIPYRPEWVWVYSFLYYPIILLVDITTKSSRQFLYVAMSYILLLAAQMSLFVLFPVKTPLEWRARNKGQTRSERFLAFVQRFDAPSNSFPSMHTSVAIMTALHLQPALGPLIFAFPLLIALSCLYTKQHYLVDVPSGAVLGWGCFKVFQLLF